MISKNEIKLIRSLKSKKNRDKSKLFVAEGEKLVRHLLDGGFSIYKVFSTGIEHSLAVDVELVSEKEMGQATHFSSSSNVLAVLHQKDSPSFVPEGKMLLLDDVRDPGNLGTIIRLADWFGVPQIICSKETVDLYNSKVIASTMGSLGNVSLIYTQLTSAISDIKESKIPVVGTLMDGENSNDYTWPDQFALVLGNEAKGISDAVIESLDVSLTIPKAKGASAESLNVAMATAVLLGSSGSVA